MYKTWEDLVKGASGDLLNTELSFVSMDKGTLHYKGDFKGAVVRCSASESCISDFDYAAVESVTKVTKGKFVVLEVGGEEVLNTH